MRRKNFRRELEFFFGRGTGGGISFRRRDELRNFRERVFLRGVESSNLRRTCASQHVSFNADELPLRNIFFDERFAVRRSFRDRNFAADAHEPTFARRIQLAVVRNSVGLRNFSDMAGDENVQPIVRVKISDAVQTEFNVTLPTKNPLQFARGIFLCRKFQPSINHRFFRANRRPL